MKDFDNLLTNELPKLNETLKAKGQPEITPPPAKMALNDADDQFGGGPLSGSADRDLPGTAATLPAEFRLLR